MSERKNIQYRVEASEHAMLRGIAGRTGVSVSDVARNAMLLGLQQLSKVHDFHAKSCTSVAPLSPTPPIPPVQEQKTLLHATCARAVFEGTTFAVWPATDARLSLAYPEFSDSERITEYVRADVWRIAESRGEPKRLTQFLLNWFAKTRQRRQNSSQPARRNGAENADAAEYWRLIYEHVKQYGAALYGGEAALEIDARAKQALRGIGGRAAIAGVLFTDKLRFLKQDFMRAYDAGGPTGGA